MKRHTVMVACCSRGPGRFVVALALGLGMPSAFVSASTFDAAPERAATHKLADAPSAPDRASPDPSASRESAVVASDSVADAVMRGPVGGVDWWTGFHDSTLNLLVQLARDRLRRAPPEHVAWRGGGGGARVRSVGDSASSTQVGANADAVAASLASAYVQARVLRIRLATAQALVMNARRQAEQSNRQAEATGAQEAAAVQRAAAMAVRAQSAAADFVATLDRRVGEIAALTGMEPAQVRTVLEPSFSSSQLPLFDVAVPSRLPARVLRGRADVRSLEGSLVRDGARAGNRQQLAEFAATLDGWIEPSGDMAADAMRRDVVARVKGEVGVALYRLVRQQQAAAMNYQLSSLRRTEFEAVLQRKELGEAAEGEVFEKHLLLLVENDRLAAAVGAIADSWIALNAATGGQAAIAASGRFSQGPPAGATQKP